jgi:hypothetical protein
MYEYDPDLDVIATMVVVVEIHSEFDHLGIARLLALVPIPLGPGRFQFRRLYRQRMMMLDSVVVSSHNESRAQCDVVECPGETTKRFGERWRRLLTTGHLHS